MSRPETETHCIVASQIDPGTSTQPPTQSRLFLQLSGRCLGCVIRGTGSIGTMVLQSNHAAIRMHLSPYCQEL